MNTNDAWSTASSSQMGGARGRGGTSFQRRSPDSGGQFFRYSDDDTAPLSNVDSSGAPGGQPATSAPEVAQQRSPGGVLGSKPRSISSKGSRHTRVSGSSNSANGSARASPPAREESPVQIVEGAAEETNELDGPADAGASEWYSQPCAIWPQLTCADPNQISVVVDDDLVDGGPRASNGPAGALNCGGNTSLAADESHFKSECKFLKNSTIETRSLAEVSEISHGWPRGFRPSPLWGRRSLKTAEDEEPVTPGTDMDTIDPENVNENWQETIKRQRWNNCKSFSRLYFVAALLIGTAGLLGGFAIGWIGEGEAEIQMVESYAATAGSREGGGSGDEKWPTYSPTYSPTQLVEEEAEEISYSENTGEAEEDLMGAAADDAAATTAFSCGDCDHEGNDAYAEVVEAAEALVETVGDAANETFVEIGEAAKVLMEAADDAANQAFDEIDQFVNEALDRFKELGPELSGGLLGGNAEAVAIDVEESDLEANVEGSSSGDEDEIESSTDEEAVVDVTEASVEEEETVVGEAEVVAIDAEESDFETNVVGSSSGDEIDAKASKGPTYPKTQLVEEETEEIKYSEKEAKQDLIITCPEGYEPLDRKRKRIRMLRIAVSKMSEKTAAEHISRHCRKVSGAEVKPSATSSAKSDKDTSLIANSSKETTAESIKPLSPSYSEVGKGICVDSLGRGYDALLYVKSVGTSAGVPVPESPYAIESAGDCPAACASSGLHNPVGYTFATMAQFVIPDFNGVNNICFCLYEDGDLDCDQFPVDGSRPYRFCMSDHGGEGSTVSSSKQEDGVTCFRNENFVSSRSTVAFTSAKPTNEMSVRAKRDARLPVSSTSANVNPAKEMTVRAKRDARLAVASTSAIPAGKAFKARK